MVAPCVENALADGDARIVYAALDGLRRIADARLLGRASVVGGGELGAGRAVWCRVRVSCTLARGCGWGCADSWPPRAGR